MAENSTTPYSSLTQPVFIAFKGDLVTVRVDAPLPPGSRVALDLPLAGAAETVHLLGKVATVTPLGDGHFRMNVRVHSVPRNVRDALVAENSA